MPSVRSPSSHEVALNSLRGKLLVASPHLPDRNFFRSVVLMLKHDDEGTWGIVLNRPTNNTVADVWAVLADEQSDCLETINLGGPVQGPLLAVHTEEECSEIEIIPGVYLATQREAIERIVREECYPFRLFTGYAGWGDGQLEQEMEMGSWLIADAHCEDIFCDEDDELWDRVSQSIGLDILTPIFGNLDPPDDPSLN